MKRVLLFLFIITSFTTLFAQNVNKSDARTASQNAVVKADGSTNAFVKSEGDSPQGATGQSAAGENVSYHPTPTGINVTIWGGTNKIQLYALTGQLIFNGELNQGRFFIPTRQGIYFLKINSKSFKVVCK